MFLIPEAAGSSLSWLEMAPQDEAGSEEGGEGAHAHVNCTDVGKWVQRWSQSKPIRSNVLGASLHSLFFGRESNHHRHPDSTTYAAYAAQVL